MTYFPDLAPFRYGFGPAGWDKNGPPSLEPTELYRWTWGPDGAFDLPELTVGWLEPPHEVPRGKMGAPLVEKLNRLCRASRYHVTRGFHPCGICGDVADGLGSKEIRLLGEGVVYAAPNLVAHYVSAHAYAPPEGFVAALKRCEGLAEPRLDVPRRVTIDMIPREDVDVARLQAKIQATLRRGHRDSTFPGLSIQDSGEALAVFARVQLGDRTEPFEHSWQVPRAALLNMDQSVDGIIGMLEATHTEHAMAQFERWRRTRGPAP